MSAAVKARARTGWYAAAACLAVAIAGWWPRLQVEWRQHGTHLLAGQDAAAEHWVWQSEPGIASNVRGGVVWDNVRQHGHVTLELLPEQMSSDQQIQLWVYDAARDERYPVTAGVFDVPAHTTRLTVPINPSLHIGRPVAFAVTLQRAGGVVVPDRTKLVAMARSGSR